MKIAVASGKGGTGKTMVATSLAVTLAADQSVRFLDCDVEAPNGHLFLQPEITETFPAVIPIPKIDSERCTLCGECVKICQYHALAKIGTKILVFPQLCHGCGSCTRGCPENAISEFNKSIGTLSHGQTESSVDFYMGELTISEPMPTPVIRQLKRLPPPDETLTILDSPPGASCSVVATVHDVDFVLLVTEPTPFGLHDLRQMLGVLEQTKTPSGVILNRDGIGDNQVESYLQKKRVPILMKIPYQSQIAAGLAKGQNLVEIFPEYRKKFQELYDRIQILPEKAR